MSTSLQHLQTRNIDEGVIRVILEDCPTGYRTGPGFLLSGMKEGPFKLEIDSDENKVEGECDSLYGRILSSAPSCKIGKYPLDGLKALLGSKVVDESSTHAWHHITNESQLPYVQFVTSSKFIPKLEGQARALCLHHLIKCTTFSYNINQDNFAEVEIEFKGQFTEFPFSTEGGRLLSMGGELNSESLSDGVTYVQPRHFLPLWAPDASSGWTGRTTDSDIIQQRAYKSDTLGEYQEFERALGAGMHVVTFIGQVGPDRGKLVVKLDGELIGEADFYALAAADNVPKTVAFTVESTGFYTLRFEITEENGDSTDNLVELASAEILQQSSSPVTVTNTLPNPVNKTYEIPAFQYSDASSPVTVVTVSPSNAAEKVEQDGLGQYIDYEQVVEPGTYSLSAVMGKGDDYGSLTFSAIVNDANQSIGIIDGYAASTETPTLLAVPGDFTVEERTTVKIRITCASNHASSTGYKRLLASLVLKRTATNHEILFGEDGESSILLLPFHANTVTNWDGAAGANVRHWVYTSDGTADAVVTWDKVLLRKGTWRARLMAEVKASGAGLKLEFNAQEVATLDLDGDPETNGRVTATFEVATATMAALTLKNPVTTEAKVYYLFLERIG